MFEAWPWTFRQGILHIRNNYECLVCGEIPIAYPVFILDRNMAPAFNDSSRRTLSD
jgi:hypothetical protein